MGTVLRRVTLSVRLSVCLSYKIVGFTSDKNKNVLQRSLDCRVTFLTLKGRDPRRHISDIRPTPTQVHGRSDVLQLETEILQLRLLLIDL